MDIDDLNGNESKEKPEKTSKSAKEEIPLWLQGLDDDKPDETKPIALDPKDADARMHEPAHSEDEIPSEVDKDVLGTMNDSIIERSDKSELGISGSSIDEEIQAKDQNEPGTNEKELSEAFNDHEITEEIEIEELLEEDLPESIDPNFEELPSPEGFVDISDLEIPEAQDQGEVLQDLDAPKEGDLPDWLKEMIAVPEETHLDNAEQGIAEEVNFLDMATENSPASWEIEHLADELEDQELTSNNEDLPDDSIDAELNLEEAIAIAKEDTSPISITQAEDFLQPAQAPQPEDSGTLDDNQVENVKQYLDQGNFIQALNIIRLLDQDNTNFDEIKTLLKKATKHNAQTNSDVWEMIGDIALKQNKPDDAYNAYAKAIEFLLERAGENDEIG